MIAPSNLPRPPKGVDVGPFDYGAWARRDMELSTYRERAEIKDGSDLRAGIEDGDRGWQRSRREVIKDGSSALVYIHSYLPRQFVSNPIDSFPGRLDLLIEKERRQFEHVGKEWGGK